MLKSFVLVAVFVGLSGCGLQEFYGKDYVLYDSDQPADGTQPEDGQAGPEGGAATDPEGVPEDPNAAGSEDAGSKGPAPSDASAPSLVSDIESTEVARVDVDRIFLLERVLDELNRAIRDGLEPAHTLMEKREAVQNELTWRRRTAGDAYTAARKRRVEALTQFETKSAK